MINESNKLKSDPVLNIIKYNIDNCPDITLAALVGSRAKGNHYNNSDYDIVIVLREKYIEPLYGIHFNVQKIPSIDFIFMSEYELHNARANNYFTNSIFLNAKILWHKCEVCNNSCIFIMEKNRDEVTCYREEAENLVWHLWNIVKKLETSEDTASFALFYAKYLYFIPNVYGRLRGQHLINEKDAMYYMKKDASDLFKCYTNILKLNPFSDDIHYILLKTNQFMDAMLNKIKWCKPDLYLEVSNLITPIDYCKFSPEQLYAAKKFGERIVEILLRGADDVTI